jgi:hypothetical protein
MFLKFEHYDLAISDVSHYGFLGGHSKKKVQKNKMNSLL